MTVLDGHVQPLVSDRPEFQSSIEAVASTASYKWRKLIPRERLIAELWSWTYENVATFELIYAKAENLDHARAASHVVLKRACYRLVGTLLSFYAPEVVEDIKAQADYKRAMIVSKLPSIWEPGFLQEPVGCVIRDPDAITAATDPRNSSDWILSAVDLKTAFDKLDPRQQLVLKLTYREEESLRTIGTRLDVTHQMVSKILDRALNRLVALINGDEKNKQALIEERRRARDTAWKAANSAA